MSDYLRRIQAVPCTGPKDRAWCEAILPVYVEMIENHVHFAQAAYRDAEFPWILGDTSIGHPNGEVWEPALGESLAHTLLHPVGQWCVFFSDPTPRRAAAVAWLKEHHPPVEWIPDRPFGRANEHGLMRPVFGAFRDRRVCLVGPKHMDALPADLLRAKGRIYVPDGTAWKAADRTAALIQQSQCDLFLIAAGSGAALTIHAAWPHVQHRATLIDIGAVLDPYAGIFSRNRVRAPEWRRDIMPKNLPYA